MPIYKRTSNLRALQILLGHTKLESPGCYLKVDAEVALARLDRLPGMVSKGQRDSPGSANASGQGAVDDCGRSVWRTAETMRYLRPRPAKRHAKKAR